MVTAAMVRMVSRCGCGVLVCLFRCGGGRRRVSQRQVYEVTCGACFVVTQQMDRGRYDAGGGRARPDGTIWGSAHTQPRPYN